MLRPARDRTKDRPRRRVLGRRARHRDERALRSVPEPPLMPWPRIEWPPTVEDAPAPEPVSDKLPWYWHVLGAVGLLVLFGVALDGAFNSFQTLTDAAEDKFGFSPDYSWTFPLLVDAGIFGGTFWYVYRVRRGFRAAGWRNLVYGLIAMTIYFNVTAGELGQAFGHVMAPALWAIITHLFAHDLLGDARRRRVQRGDDEPVRRWLALLLDPRGSFTLIRHEILSRVVTEAVRLDLEARRRERTIRDAALLALRTSLPGWSRPVRRTRREVRRQLRVLGPDTVIAAVERAETLVPADAKDRVEQLAVRVLRLTTAAVAAGRKIPRTVSAPVPPTGSAPPPPPDLDDEHPDPDDERDDEKETERTAKGGPGNRRTPEQKEAGYQRYAAARQLADLKGEKLTNDQLGRFLDPDALPADESDAARFAGGRIRKTWEQRYAQEHPETATASAL